MDERRVEKRRGRRGVLIRIRAMANLCKVKRYVQSCVSFKAHMIFIGKCTDNIATSVCVDVCVGVGV